jgi:hypothetical protein
MQDLILRAAFQILKRKNEPLFGDCEALILGMSVGKAL